MNPFPDIIGDTLDLQPFYNVQTQPMGENHVVRYRKWLRPRWSFHATWSLLDAGQARSISDHVVSVAGALQAFDWFFWQQFHWIYVPLGVGDGTTTVWTIPGLATSQQEFFVNANTTVTGTVTAGTGAQGEDSVTISPAVANGVPIWTNFRGRRRFTVVYERDEQPLTRTAENGQYAFNTTFRQVK
jgi:hypothetical protein